MIRLHGLPLLLLCAALAACGSDAPPAGPAHPASASPPPPSGPVLAFDGDYTGPITLNPDRTRACRAPTSQVRLTIAQGRGSMLIDPQTRQTLSGVVGRDGSLRLADRIDRTIATNGQINDGVFTGFHRAGQCEYSVRLTKQN